MTWITRGVTPRSKRVCIFVDGENFRHSLGDLFEGGGYSFRREDYLPDTDWHKFFMSFISRRSGWELIRVYWYVIREIDYWPYKVPYEWEKKRRLLVGSGIVEALNDQGLSITDNNDGLKSAETELKNRRASFQRRADGWQTVQSSIERQYDQIQFQRVGSIRYDLPKRALGTEKGVDTKLATDMITLADIYDVAVVVSGDADYIPPVAAVKSMGKLVYSVTFLTANGKKLPGGAWRLERSVDGQIDVPFEQARRLLGVERL